MLTWDRTDHTVLPDVETLVQILTLGPELRGKKGCVPLEFHNYSLVVKYQKLMKSVTNTTH